MAKDITASEITVLLDGAAGGDPEAVERLFRVVYAELRKIAHAHRRRWDGNQTLNTTALIHESFVKLAGKSDWKNRGHFYATAAKAMRHVLVNYAERQRSAKRGGTAVPVPLEPTLLAAEGAADEVLSLHQGRAALEAEHPRAARVIECRFFGGMGVEECAAALETSPATVKRDGAFARAWLHRYLEATGAADARPEQAP